MVRRRYQQGHLFKRGKRWVARFREMLIQPDGSTRTILRSVVIASVRDVPTRGEARRILDGRLNQLTQGSPRIQTIGTFADFTVKWADAVLPTYRASTRQFYVGILRRHLVPYFGSTWSGERSTSGAPFTAANSARRSPRRVSGPSPLVQGSLSSSGRTGRAARSIRVRSSSQTLWASRTNPTTSFKGSCGLRCVLWVCPRRDGEGSDEPSPPLSANCESRSRRPSRSWGTLLRKQLWAFTPSSWRNRNAAPCSSWKS